MTVLRRFLEERTPLFIAGLIVVFAGTTALSFFGGWSLVDWWLEWKLAGGVPSTARFAAVHPASPVWRNLGAVDLTPLPELTLRACHPKSQQPCVTAPLAFVTLPASDRWADEANDAFGKLLTGRRGPTSCRALSGPALEIDCTFGDDDPRAALLATGLVSLDEDACASAGQRSLCAALAADQRVAESRRRGIWATEPWARGAGDAVATIYAGAAAFFASSVVVAGGLCVALWYAVNGGAEGLATRLRDEESDRTLLALIYTELNAARGPDDAKQSFGDRSDPGFDRLRIVENLKNPVARAEISTAIRATLNANPVVFSPAKDDALEAVKKYQKSPSSREAT